MADFFSKGLSFVPDTHMDLVKTIVDLKLFVRKLNLLAVLGKHSSLVKPFRISSLFNPPLVSNLKTFEKSCELDLRFLSASKTNKSKHTLNITTEQRDFIKLLQDCNIRVMKPDKGGGLVFMNQADYINKLSTHLDDGPYEDTSINEVNMAHSRIRAIIEDLFLEDIIDIDTHTYLNMTSPRMPSFFGAPKIHKSVNEPPFRPIVDGRGSILTACAKYVDSLLKPYIAKETQICKDSWGFLDDINKIPFDPNLTFMTVDVKDLYTVIPQQLGLQWIREFLEERRVPISVCTESCSPGYRKADQRGQPKCCFICIPCSEGEISNQTDSVECLICPDDYMSNERRDLCLPKAVEFLAYEDPLGAALATLAILFALMPTAILIIFSLYKQTPIVRANNREISYFLLVALVLCYLCSLIFIGRPNRVTCLIQQTTFGIVFAFCVSCVLAKTIMVVIAFKATKPNSSLRKWVGPALPITIIFCCTLSQIILCIVWLLISPPFPEANIKYLSTKIVIQCNEGSTLAFWCMLGYMGLLSCASFVMAFLARKLPDSFNEAQFITFSMLVFVSVWISFIPAYLSTKGKYMVAVEIFAILSSSAGLLSCIFLPKCYIILLRPDMNIKDYLMGKRPGSNMKTIIIEH
ncbi:vomeronasal type-2 receptor 26-like [Protopterus annectens]|uniref:vomeronasal type-2 receptor 26-like n=1 Tax=Protopterus annectens TaxID=7888 RepID=UPI001CFB9B35|nr:vomeronasal type-2 receptor 26-like [Protopterus annectens]